MEGIYQAIYAAENYLPKPFSSFQYFYRILDVDVLLQTGFTKLRGNINKDDLKHSLKLPKKTSNKNFVKLNESHLDQAFDILNAYFQKYYIRPIFTKELFRHIFLDNEFVTCYVLLDENGCVVDMVSFYELPLRVINKNNKYEFIRAAYLYYYSSNCETPYRLISDIMIIAKDMGIHVFASLNSMEHASILKDLKFEESGKPLNYYLYNWMCPDMDPSQVAKLFV